MVDSRLTDYLRGHLARAAGALGLDQATAQLLWWLVPLEIDPNLAMELEQADVYGRKGIVPWSAVAARGPDVQQATATAFRWGLIEVVGALSQDPRTSGPAPLRLSHAGRVVTGLAPHLLSPDRIELPQAVVQSDQWQGWTIMHSASREALVAEAAAQLHPSIHPLWLEVPNRDSETWLHAQAGRIAIRLATWGACVIDAFDLAANHRPLLADLLRHTAGGPAVRALLLPDPLEVRTAGLAAKVRGLWVQPKLDVRREKLVADQRMEQAAGWSFATAADGAGVPDSRVAILREPRVGRADITLEDELWARIDRCFQAARWRVGEITGDKALLRHAHGYRLLLSGPPGVGKSMFAEVLASELSRPLVRLDLSTVLSRWLGETEQHIAELFDVAEGAGAVLLMDECESLLKQREGDSGGSALQTGVAYLLTRLEAYEGVLVATTNRVRDLDEAFFRRFDDHVALSVPERETRLALWRRMLGDEIADRVDLKILAREFPIGGAMIRGATLRARSWAAAENEEVDTAVLLAALTRELEKHERSWSDANLRRYRDDMQRWLNAHPVDEPPREVKRPWQR